MTPDWAARPTTVPYAVFGDPQSLNLYNYVRNDPVSRVDPDGHYEVNASGRVAQPFALFAKAGVVHSAGGPAFRVFCEGWGSSVAGSPR